MTAIIAQLVLGVLTSLILASLIVRGFRAGGNSAADAGGARLAGPQNMIATLARLRQNLGRPHLPDQMAAFGISGNIGRGVKRLFMTHPPLEERIATLQSADDQSRLPPRRRSRATEKLPTAKVLVEPQQYGCAGGDGSAIRSAPPAIVSAPDYGFLRTPWAPWLGVWALNAFCPTCPKRTSSIRNR